MRKYQNGEAEEIKTRSQNCTRNTKKEVPEYAQFNNRVRRDVKILDLTTQN